jgi:hypothetical protein
VDEHLIKIEFALKILLKALPENYKCEEKEISKYLNKVRYSCVEYGCFIKCLVDSNLISDKDMPEFGPGSVVYNAVHHRP